MSFCFFVIDGLFHVTTLVVSCSLTSGSPSSCDNLKLTSVASISSGFGPVGAGIVTTLLVWNKY